MVNVKEKLDAGYIQCRVIIELVGKPKEHIEKTLRSYVEKIKQNENYDVLEQEYAQAPELKPSASWLYHCGAFFEPGPTVT